MLTENLRCRRYQVVRDLVVVNLPDQKLAVHRHLCVFPVRKPSECSKQQQKQQQKQKQNNKGFLDLR